MPDPEELKKENKEYKGRSGGPGGIQFIYGEGIRDAITYQSHFPEEGDMFIFPAWLKHWVSPLNQTALEYLSLVIFTTLLLLIISTRP